MSPCLPSVFSSDVTYLAPILDQLSHSNQTLNNSFLRVPRFNFTFYRTLPPKLPITSKISCQTSLQNLKENASSVASTPLLSHSFIFFRLYFFINAYVAVFLFNNVIYVFLLLCLCILIVWLCIFIVPVGTLRLPSRRFLRAFSSVVRQINASVIPANMGHVPHSSKIFVLFCLLFVLCRSVYCVCKCVLPYCHRLATQLQLTNISYHIIS